MITTLPRKTHLKATPQQRSLLSTALNPFLFENTKQWEARHEFRKCLEDIIHQASEVSLLLELDSRLETRLPEVSRQLLLLQATIKKLGL